MRKLLTILSFFILSNLFAQEAPQKTKILFILDASASMLQDWDGVNKLAVAKDVISQVVDNLDKEENVEFGLRVFGSISPNTDKNCRDTKLEASIRADNAEYLKSKLKAVRARGITPIAYALEQCQRDFLNAKSTRNIVILVTDGAESCDGDPCAVSRALQEKGIILKPFIIGIGNDYNLKEAFECVGKFFDASKRETFPQILNNVVSQVLSTTTAQVNLLDALGKPTETNIPISFYDTFSGLRKNDFIHTLNSRGQPDTLSLDPVFDYKLVVHTTPPVILDKITVIPGKHNVISVNAAQGDLDLNVKGSTNYTNLRCVIKKKGKSEIITVQDFNTKSKYLVGTYDLTALTLPPLQISNITIKANYTKTINIPAPGLLTILNTDGVPVYGSVYTEVGTDLVWVCDIRGNSSSETITMQPGNYRLVYRNRGSKRAITTQEIQFVIKSGGSETIKM
ncbi:MAG: Ca-activated chloride channel family protein [Sphingobacteriales bacterium]|jgi:Ca-activated chloride channel family protein